MKIKEIVLLFVVVKRAVSFLKLTSGVQELMALFPGKEYNEQYLALKYAWFDIRQKERRHTREFDL